MTFLQAGKKQIGFNENFDKDGSKSIFISESPVMKMISNKIEDLASLSSPVLILGAIGTGRETITQRIFNESKQKYFIKLVCYGLDQKSIEQKLFCKKEGLLNHFADRFIFIKGLECMGVDLQRKLLSYLLDSKNRENQTRLICSASENLTQKVKEGHFSQEIFEILSKNLLILPSLSERIEDIPSFVFLFNRRNGFQGLMTKTALQVLKSHPWKENIKELQKVCLRIFVAYKDKELITEEDLEGLSHQKLSLKSPLSYDPQLSLDNLINYYIQMSLNHFQSKKKSAEALGISVKTIYNKIKTGVVTF